jgi:subtilisin family serine protease
MLALSFLAAACSKSSAPTVTSVAVTPATSDVIAAGAAVALTARATYSDSSTADVSSQATWTTSDAGLVVVSASGSATAPATALVGSTATVTASLAGLQGSSALRVVRAAAYGPDLSNDPLITQQWYIRNTGTAQAAYADTGGVAGQDLKLATAWSLGITGKGVTVAIVDDGLQIDHEDLVGNAVPGVPGSWNFVDGTANPSPTHPDDNHGTSVAGITAMVYGNAKGGAGVAPGVSLNGYNVISKLSTFDVSFFERALGGSTSSPNSSDIWIFNQSYGYSPIRPRAVDQPIEDTYAAGTRSLRKGRGALYVKSAGNDFLSLKNGDCTAANALGVTCENASMDGTNAVPYNILVGALSAKGKKASYSTAGSALWASATGGEAGANASQTSPANTYYDPPRPWPATEFEAAMVTSDRMNCTVGYSLSVPVKETWRSYSAFDLGISSSNTPCNYTNSMSGTSSAAPSTTGVIALLLEARPELTWREVKHLLARTGRKVDADIAAVNATLSNGTYVAELPWTTNKAGYNFHNWYGFGAVDASAALDAARTFTLGSLGTFENTGWVSSAAGLALGIPDNSVDGKSSTLTVTGSLVIEAVQIDVAFTHVRPGDVGIELTSPSGSTSILLNIRNGLPPAGDPGPSSLVSGIFLSNLFYGEPSIGNWTIKLVDGVAGVTGTLDQWKIRIYGHK